MMTRFKTTVSAALVMVVLCAVVSRMAWASHKLFILHSYEQDHVCGQPQADGVIHALEEAGFSVGVGVEVRSYYMDTKITHTTPAAMEKQARQAGKIIEAFDPTVLVTIDDNAFRLVGMNYAGSDRPVVFCGLNGQPEAYNRQARIMESRDKPGHNITGVYELLHIVDAIRVHRTVFPGLKSIRILVDRDSATGKAIQQQVLQELKILPSDQWTMEVVPSLEAYRNALVRANNDPDVGAIYPVALALKDAGGKVHTAPQIFDLTLRVSKKPEMALNYAFCRMGLFGGAAVDFHAMGKQAGKMVVRIFKGTRPGSIAIEEAREYALAFNLDRAQALGITIPEEVLAAADDIFVSR